jgi:hypothetical protein
LAERQPYNAESASANLSNGILPLGQISSQALLTLA